MLVLRVSVPGKRVNRDRKNLYTYYLMCSFPQNTWKYIGERVWNLFSNLVLMYLSCSRLRGSSGLEDKKKSLTDVTCLSAILKKPVQKPCGMLILSLLCVCDWTDTTKTLNYLYGVIFLPYGFALRTTTVHSTLKLKTYITAQKSYCASHLFWLILLIKCTKHFTDCSENISNQYTVSLGFFSFSSCLSSGFAQLCTFSVTEMCLGSF